MNGCTKTVSGKWRIGLTGKGKYNSEEECLRVWDQMNGGGRTSLRRFPKRKVKKEGLRSTIKGRNRFSQKQTRL